MRTAIRATVLALIGCALYLVLAAPPGQRSLRAFDPGRMAQLELDMWQAYYRKERLRLFSDLVTSLHEQNRYPWAKATMAGFHLARAAARFGDMRSGYETVLPDLEAAYRTARDWTGAGFDPVQVARAELAWWVARRDPHHNSPEEVGGLIADENAMLYEVPRERVLGASVLRARAGRLRDDGGEQADWAAVASLLVQSYRALYDAVQEGAR